MKSPMGVNKVTVTSFASLQEIANNLEAEVKALGGEEKLEGVIITSADEKAENKVVDMVRI